MTARNRSILKFNRDIEARMIETREKVHELDEKIAFKERRGEELKARYATLYPGRVLVLFDVRHSAGFTYRNKPFWRTIGGFLGCIFASWLVVELLQAFSVLPTSLSSAFSRLVVSILGAVVTVLLLSYEYDYRRCDLCGFPKNSWGSPLCSRCWRDFKLKELEEKIVKEIEDAWTKDTKERKTSKQEGTEDHCSFCGGELVWHDGWRRFVCPSHGDLETQFLYKRRRDSQEAYEDTKKLLIPFT